MEGVRRDTDGGSPGAVGGGGGADGALLETSSVGTGRVGSFEGRCAREYIFSITTSKSSRFSTSAGRLRFARGLSSGSSGTDSNGRRLSELLRLVGVTGSRGIGGEESTCSPSLGGDAISELLRLVGVTGSRGIGGEASTCSPSLGGDAISELLRLVGITGSRGIGGEESTFSPSLGGDAINLPHPLTVSNVPG